MNGKGVNSVVWIKRTRVSLVLIVFVLSVIFILPTFASADLYPWQQVNIDGFGNSDNFRTRPMVRLNDGYIYAEASNKYTGVSDNLGVTIWRSSDGINWSQFPSPGLSDPNNTTIHLQGVFNGYLYLPAENNQTGVQIWRTDGVITPEKVNENGFGNLENKKARAIGNVGDYLYFGTEKNNSTTTGAEVWRFNPGAFNPQNPQAAWEQVNIDGFGDSNNFGTGPGGAAYGDYIYIGTKNQNTGTQVWRFNPGVFNPQNPQAAWEPMNDSSSNIDPNNWNSHLSIFNGKIYVGTGTKNNTGGSVYRYTEDPTGPIDKTKWERIPLLPGINNTNSTAIKLTSGVVTDTLYAGTWNQIDGVEVYKTTNGDSWERISTGGHGDINNWENYPWLVDNGYLYDGTWKDPIKNSGGEIWRLDIGAPTTTLTTNPVSPDGTNGWFKTTPSITLTRDEPGVTYYSWTLATGPWTTYSIPFNAPEGQNTLYYYSVDTAGNAEAVNPPLLFKVDTVAPTVFDLTYPANNFVSPSNMLKLNWNKSSDSNSGLTKYQLYIDGSLNRDNIEKNQPQPNITPTSALSNGTHSWYIKAIDKAGNSTNSTSIWNIEVEFDLTSPANGATIWNNQPTFAWGYTLDVAKYQLFVDGSLNRDNISPLATSALPTSPLSSGSHTWYVKAIDALGNTHNSTSTRTVVIDPSSETWSQVNLNGFGNSANFRTRPMVNFNGYIYAEASNNSGVTIWRSFDSVNWSQVTSSGFNDPNNVIIHSQAIFSGSLYLPTGNSITGTEVWKTDGTTWTQVNIDGFGDKDNKQARALGVEGGYLYFGTHNEKTGAEVWRTDGTIWEQVNSDGFGDIKNFKIVPGLTYGGYVYTVTKNNDTGAEVWRFNPQIFDPQNPQAAWEQINTDGFGSASNNGSAPSVFKGKLYVGTQNNTGGSVYRYKGNLSDPTDPTDPANWEQVASSGINDTNNIAIMLTPRVVTDTLYAGAANLVDGSKVFKTTDGDNWTQISTGGFGDINNISDIWPWLINNGYLYAGTVNPVTGGEIWALQLEDTTAPTTPSNLNAIPISSSQINLSWNASTDDVGVTGYKIYNADTNAEIATTASTLYSHSGLNPDTTYRYYVKAYDAAGNLSGSSNTVSATTYKAPVPTSTGPNVPIDLGNDVGLDFDQVTGSGTTSVTVSTTAPAPLPSGFNLLGLYYDVSTTATFSGKIRVIFPYDESQVTGPEADLRLFHWEGGVWTDVTVLPVDTVNNLITGEVTSLSPFGVGSPSGSVPSTGFNTYWLLIVGISLMIGGGRLLLKGKRRLV